MDSRNGYNNPARVSGFYRRLARSYDSFDARWKLPYRKAYLTLDRAYEAHLPPNGRVLDLGCGTGLNVERIQALGLSLGSYIGIDLSEEMLARAKAKYGHLGEVDFRQMNISEEPLPKGSFDMIVSTWVFEHLSNPVIVAERAWQQLAAGGYMVLLFMVRKRWVNLVAPLTKLLKVPISYGVEENAYRRFPGMVSMDRFVGGTAALVILHKPEKS